MRLVGKLIEQHLPDLHGSLNMRDDVSMILTQCFLGLFADQFSVETVVRSGVVDSVVEGNGFLVCLFLAFKRGLVCG